MKNNYKTWRPLALLALLITGMQYGQAQSTVFPENVTPANVDPETGKVELGMRFRSSHNGTITALRFLKSATNTGLHVGSLWTTDGLRLRKDTFVNETASGWQQVTLTKPLRVKAGVTYIVSYHTPSGHYSYDTGYFANDIVSGDITVLASDFFGIDGANGIYDYIPESGFPVKGSTNRANYWVDFVYQRGWFGDVTPPTAPGNLTGTALSSSRVKLTWNRSTDIAGVTGYYIHRNGSIEPIAFTTDTTYTDTALAPGSTYNYYVKAADPEENFSDASWTVTVKTLAATTAVNRAIHLDGMDDFIAVYNGADLALKDFTFEVWLKVDPGAKSGYVYTNTWPFQVKVGPNAVMCNMSDWGKIVMENVDNTSDWVYYAFVRKDTLLYGYRNGVPVDTVYVGNTLVDMTGNIGGLQSDQFDARSKDNFKGSLDEMRISKAARSAADIAAVWNGGVGQFYQTDSITEALWHFNEGAGNTVYDYSPNGHEGQLKPAYPANQGSWTSGFPFANTRDFNVFLPDFHSRIGIRPLVLISGASPTDQFKATLDGAVVFTPSGQLPLKLRFPVSLRTLSAGTHTFTWQLRKQDGTLIKTITTNFNKPVSGIPRIGIDEDNAPNADGVRTPFMLVPFLAQYSWLDSSSSGWVQYQPLAVTGFFSKDYAYRSDTFTDWAWTRGLYSIQGDDSGNIVQYVNRLKNKPGLLAYNWLDEPDLHGVKAARLRAWTDTTHAHDAQHPVIVNFQGASAIRPDAPTWRQRTRSYGYPRLATDMFMFDYYTKAETGSANITFEQALDNLAGAAENFRTWTNDQPPLWSFVQPCKFSDKSKEAEPTVTELRVTYWVNIIHGVKGIGWFTHFLPTPDANFKEMSRLADQSHRLRDVIYSPEAENTVTHRELQNGRVDIVTKVYDGKTYIFAANMRNAAQQVKFTYNNAPSGDSVTVFDENRKVALSASTFTDTFAAYSVHIYVVDESAALVLADSAVHTLNANHQPVKDDGITCSPNPFNSNVTVSVGEDITVKGVTIYDNQGRVQQVISGSATTGSVFTLTVKNFNPGLYIFRFNTNRGIKIKKLLRK